MNRGEVWIAQLDPKKGLEVGKQRPVLILQTDLLNTVGHPTTIILPISSQSRSENILRLKITYPFLDQGIGYILLDQPRTVDTNARLKTKIGSIHAQDLKKVSLLLRQVLDLG